MVHNKGARLVFCKECKRKRFCIRISIPGYNFRYTCSKGHTWTIKGITAERVVAAMQDVINPEMVKNLFERDNAFYTEMRKK